LTFLLLAAALLVASPIVVAEGEENSTDHECSTDEVKVYDYVVVGAGTGGSAAAAVLAESLPGASVLLMDHGKDYSDSNIVMDNDEFSGIMRTPYCENLFSTEDALGGGEGAWLQKRDIYMCVAKIFGGASAVNYGGWYRPPASDLDEWASVTKSGNDDEEDLWSYDAMLPIFERLERVNDTGAEDGAQLLENRFYDGVIPVKHQNVSALYARTGLLSIISDTFGVVPGDQNNNGREQAGMNTLEVTRVEDGCWHDEDGNVLGCAKNMRNGSSYNAFVRDPQRDGKLPNLDILDGAKVVRVEGIFEDDDEEENVVISYVKKGRLHTVEAKQEVLLSAGSWGNPKIAMLSGIGNATELENVGIEAKIDSPAVGRVKDHGVLWLRAVLNKLPDVLATDSGSMDGTANADTDADASEVAVDASGCEDTIESNPVCSFGQICDCETLVNAEESTGCGGVYTNQFGDINVNDLCPSYCDACPDEGEDPPAAVEREGMLTTEEMMDDFSSFRGVDNPLPALMSDFNSFNFYFKSDDSLEFPDMEFLGGISPTGPSSGFMALRIYQNKGTSGEGGYMRLRSDDPNEDMDVTRSFYAFDGSIDPMLKSLKKAVAMITNLTDSHGAMMIEPNTFTVDVEDDEALKKYIKENVVSEMHLQASMRMGTAENGAVVDKHLKIIGSNGRIRVADTSSFPDEIRGHSMATAMAVGIKAADIIAADAPLYLKTGSANVTTSSAAAVDSIALGGSLPLAFVVGTVTVLCGWIAVW